MTQLELEIHRFPEDDRNLDKGGRSFYFFDFDDNIAILKTPVYIFHNETNHEIKLSSREFAEVHGLLGRTGDYDKYEVRHSDAHGSFRRFRDREISAMEQTSGHRQDFVHDLEEVLAHPKEQWQGPSWSCFYHAVFNKRPITLITARGHHPETMKEGIRLLVDRGFLPHEPNYLGIYPVSHPDLRAELAPIYGEDIASLKKAAVHKAFELGIQQYGLNSHHRFGISDDDPRNIQLMTEAFLDLKRVHPMMSFFIISTCDGGFLKQELFLDEGRKSNDTAHQQISLFRKED